MMEPLRPKTHLLIVIVILAILCLQFAGAHHCDVFWKTTFKRHIPTRPHSDTKALTQNGISVLPTAPTPCARPNCFITKQFDVDTRNEWSSSSVRPSPRQRIVLLKDDLANGSNVFAGFLGNHEKKPEDILTFVELVYTAGSLYDPMR